MISSKKQFKRRISKTDGMYSLEEEMGMHVAIWLQDTRWKTLHPSVKNALMFFRDSIAAGESLKDMEAVAHEKVKDITTSEVNRFLAIYQNKYVEMTDLDCPEVLDPGGRVILRGLVKKIQDSGSSVSEYLMWFFDKILPSSNSLSPSLRLVMSGAMFSKFVYEMREELLQRRRKVAEETERLFLINLATDLYDATEDYELACIVIQWKKGHTTGNKLKQKILEVASKAGLDSIIKRLEKGPQLEAMLADSNKPNPEPTQDEEKTIEGDKTNDGQNKNA